MRTAVAEPGSSGGTRYGAPNVAGQSSTKIPIDLKCSAPSKTYPKTTLSSGYRRRRVSFGIGFNRPYRTAGRLSSCGRPTQSREHRHFQRKRPRLGEVPGMDHAARMAKARGLMAAQQIDMLAVSPSDDMYYLLGDSA